MTPINGDELIKALEEELDRAESRARDAAFNHVCLEMMTDDYANRGKSPALDLLIDWGHDNPLVQILDFERGHYAIMRFVTICAPEEGYYAASRVYMDVYFEVGVDNNVYCTLIGDLNTLPEHCRVGADILNCCTHVDEEYLFFRHPFFIHNARVYKNRAYKCCDVQAIIDWLVTNAEFSTANIRNRFAQLVEVYKQSRK